MMIKPIHLFACLVIGFILGILATVIYSPQSQSSPTEAIKNLLREKDKAYNYAKYQEQRFKDTIKQKDAQIIEIHLVRINAQNEVEKLKKENSRLKSQKPMTLRDSAAWLTKVNSNCESTVEAQDKTIKAFDSELNETNEKVWALDSIVKAKDVQVKVALQKDSIHVDLLNKAIDDGKKKFVKGMAWGAGILIVLEVVISILVK
jgi:peptidoglycan hydrolase CwlO-like protein